VVVQVQQHGTARNGAAGAPQSGASAPAQAASGPASAPAGN